jgi:hypothetical protein
LDLILTGPSPASSTSPLPPETTTTALKALNTLLLKTASDKREWREGAPPAPALNSEDITVFKESAQKIIARFMVYIDGSKSNNGNSSSSSSSSNITNSTIPTSSSSSSTSRDLQHEQSLHYITFLSRLASHHSFTLYRKPALEVLLTCLALAEVLFLSFFRPNRS